MEKFATIYHRAAERYGSEEALVLVDYLVEG